MFRRRLSVRLKNNVQIADLILQWIDERVSKRSVEKK